MNSFAGDSSLRDHLESLLSAIQPEETWALQQFSESVDEVVKEVRRLAHAISCQKRVVFSTDLCELIDCSMSDHERRLRLSTEPNLLRRRRVITDVVFAKKAMKELLEEAVPFTIMPGAAAEILFFLRRSYSRNRQLLKNLRAVPTNETPSDRLQKFGLASSSYLKFEEVVRGGAFGVAFVDRFISFVGRLLAKENFVSARDVAGLYDVPGDLVGEFLAALSVIRPEGKGSFNNVADAINLGLACEISGLAGAEKVVHITRTWALHRLRRGGVLRIEVGLSLEEENVIVPVLARPQVLYLLSQVLKARRRPEQCFRLAEKLSRHAATVASKLREYAHALQSGESMVTVRLLLEDLIKKTEAEAEVEGILDEYLRAYLLNAVESEQMGAADAPEDLLDRKRQLEELEESITEGRAMARQEQIESLYEVLLEKSGPQRAVQSVALPRTVGRPRMRVEDDGFVVVEAVPEREGDTREFQASAVGERALISRESGVPIGLQCFKYEGRRCGVLYWPTEGGTRRFIDAVACYLKGRDEDSECTVAAVGMDDEFEALAMTLKHLKPSSVLLGALRHRPARLLVVEAGGLVFTFEATTKRPQAYTSIRFTENLPSDVAAFYAEASNLLPKSHVENFAQELWSS